ncbi:MAG: hypothetical protein ACKO0Z_14775 [Betaproteobacteria bacterium]
MATYYVRYAGAVGSYFTSPYQSLKDLPALTASDTVYVASDHAAPAGYLTTAVALSLPTSPGLRILSVDTTTLALTEGGSETGALAYTIDGCVYMYGMALTAGSGSATNLNLAFGATTTTNAVQAYVKCTMKLATTNNSGRIAFGGASSSMRKLAFQSTVFRFATTSQYFTFYTPTDFYNCSLDSAGSAPTALFSVVSNSVSPLITAVGCDWSFASALALVTPQRPAQFKFVGCKTPATTTSGSFPGPGATELELQGCGASTNSYGYEAHSASGSVVVDTTAYLASGGLSLPNGSGTLVPQSHKMTAGAYISATAPLVTPWYNVKLSSTGTKSLSIRVACVTNQLTDLDAWLEVEYLSQSGVPQSATSVDAPVVSGTNNVNLLATPTSRTNTSVSWTGLTTPYTHTFTKSVTVNQQGFARARIVLVAGYTIYVDPQIVVA